MDLLVAAFVVFPAFCLLLAGLLPKRVTLRHVAVVRKMITALTGIQFVAAIVSFLLLLPGLLSGGKGVVGHWPSSFGVSLYFDGFASLMLCLVSFVGFVVSRYSIRYLDGEERQGPFFRWLALTIGAVSMVTVAGNLVVLLLAWVVTSMGLHQLLLHYPNRHGAVRAAWTKFAISRVGDVMFFAAVILLYREFGTFEIPAIFAAVSSGMASTGLIHTVCWLLLIVAVTKSAQFPLHTWLPETLETPTPVSALMHAGIVNAGGYLVIRMSPLFVAAPSVLATLAIIGSLTVAYAGVVLLTQTSVKRTLAYSTIAQMGFMMLQCGLGAFSAAMLHILAHSLYKAYSFLNSGSVLSEAAGMRKPVVATGSFGISLAGALLVAALSVFSAATLLSVSLVGKPGGLVLGVVLTLALASWLSSMFRLKNAGTTLAGIAATFCLATCYMLGYTVVDQLVAGTAAKLVSTGYLNAVAATDVVIIFCGLFGLHFLLATPQGKTIAAPLQVHAANGFYFDVLTHRIFNRLRAN